uniref:ATP-dependent DNA helicase n=1 Tax=Amphimedon queenslandica TaxID=400682 RepID=A0A1X7UDL3_AMPQE
MLFKNLYIHWKHFSLILSYAITIHKCQGLSLDTAIIDLSTNVFGDGMAYVALFRVGTLNGLHLL